jgi:hypothetical protein
MRLSAEDPPLLIISRMRRSYGDSSTTTGNFEAMCGALAEFLTKQTE